LQDEAAGLAPGSPLRVYLDQYIARLVAIPSTVDTSIGATYTGRGPSHLAGGGPALPGRVYTVGERGEETLVMGASGGYVIPNSGGASKGMTDDRIVEWLQHIHTALSQRPPTPFNTTAYGRS
jgi:hypothetical protein